MMRRPTRSSIEATDVHQQLQFNESLTWNVGSKISVADLLRRLQSLYKEIRDIDQTEAHQASFVKIASQLANQQLLGHKDVGVKAWTACCLVEVFRICAPDAPFSQTQVKEIFQLFNKSILPAVADPMNSYNAQHLQVLQSLAEVKSVLVIMENPSASSLITEIFSTCFNVLSNPNNELSKNVEFNMTMLLQCLVEESDSLPPDVVETIMMQFMRADPRATGSRLNPGKKASGSQAPDQSQTMLQFKQLPPAYNVAKNLCNTTVDRMARYTSQYFGSVIMDASEAGRRDKDTRKSKGRTSTATIDSDDNEEDGTSEEDFKELEKAHLLLRELWRSCPGVLQNVIPQVEAEISAENVHLRLLATQAIGDLCSGIGSAGPPPSPSLDPAAYPYTTVVDAERDATASNGASNAASTQSFPQSHPSAYNSFLGRQNDKSPLIRSAWTVCIGRIISSSAGGSGLEAHDEQKLVRQLSQMLLDNDEKVRLAAVRALGSFRFADFVLKLGSLAESSHSASLMKNLTDRIKDRKQPVSAEATLLLGKLWGVGAGELLAGNDQVKNLLGSVPSRIFEAIYVNERELNATLDRVLFEYLMPMNFPSMKKKQTAQGDAAGQEQPPEADADYIRAERLLLLVRDLEPRSKTALFAWLSRPAKLAPYMNMFLQRCEQYNGGVMDSNEAETKKYMSGLIDLFCKNQPDPIRASEDLWKFAKIHDRRSYSLIRFCIATESDFRKVYKSFKELSRRLEGHTTVVETLTHVLYQCSNLLYNKSHISPIIQFSQTDADGLGPIAQELLKEISEKSPAVFKAHAEELCRTLEANAPKATKPNDAGVLNEMRACATFARRFPGDMPKDRKYLQAIAQYALYGTPTKTAKHAVTLLLSCAEKKDMHARNLIQQCIKDFEYGSEHFLARLASLSQLALMAVNEFENSSDEIAEITIDQILLKVRTKKQADEPEWQEVPDQETEAKMWALKILANRIRAQDDVEVAKEISEPVYRLLNKLIAGSGELLSNKSTPKAQKARLRLQAALLLLKLCTNKHFDSLLTPAAFNKLATVAQDPLFQVRQAFVTKVKKYLGQEKIHPRFYGIIFLLEFEPSEKLKRDTLTWVRARAMTLRKAKKYALEQTFARFLSLLAHHPDFEQTAEDLVDFAPYIIFYIEAVATEENLSLLYHIAQRIKGVQDGIEPATSDKLYSLSDLAQALIRQLEDARNWSMQTYTAKFQPPSGVFAPLPSHTVAKEIAQTSYLPEGVIDQIEGMVKASTRVKKRKPDPKSHDNPPAKRRSTASTASAPASGATTTTKLAVRSSKKPAQKAAKRKAKPKAKNDDDEGSDAPGADPPSSERRRSTRVSRTNYAESDDGEGGGGGGGQAEVEEESE